MFDVFASFFIYLKLAWKLHAAGILFCHCSSPVPRPIPCISGARTYPGNLWLCTIDQNYVTWPPWLPRNLGKQVWVFGFLAFIVLAANEMGLNQAQDNVELVGGGLCYSDLQMIFIFFLQCRVQGSSAHGPPRLGWCAIFLLYVSLRFRLSSSPAVCWTSPTDAS